MVARVARHRRSRRFPALALEVLVTIVAAGVAVAVMRGDDPAPASSNSTAQVAIAPSSGPEATQSDLPTSAASATPATPIACREAIAAAEAVVDAARTGVGHWAAHVQARTDLRAGKITEDEMRATWKATRLAGPGDVASVDVATSAYEPQADVCAHVEQSSVPAGLSVAMGRCLERNEAAEAAVETGRAAMADWSAHLEAMAQFADGDFDAAHAQHLWETAWAKAPVNIDAFRAADQALQSAPACELAH